MGVLCKRKELLFGLSTSLFPLYFFLDKKVPKNQDCACLAQKTCAQLFFGSPGKVDPRGGTVFSQKKGANAAPSFY